MKWSQAGLVTIAAVCLGPQAGAALAADSNIVFLWSGAVTPTSVRATAKLVPDHAEARLAVSTTPDFATPHYSGFDTAIAFLNNRVVSFDVAGLTPDIHYYYAVEVEGTLDTSRVGRFRTFPIDSGSFVFAFASCARTASNHAVFETIRALDPLFFLHTGDFHYEDIAVDDRDTFRAAYETVLASPGQSRLYREFPIAYIWDDHDFGPNNSDSTAPGRAAARLTYREYVPHYPLPAGTGAEAIYQAFTVGRVRFIVCDSRSARSPASAPDVAGKTMLGSTQKTWLKQELLAAHDVYPLIVWVNTLPWIGVTGDDGWYLYTQERRELADFIAVNHIDNLCMLSGDAHMLAIDDGTNSDYATAGGAAFPVMQAAALDQSGSVKGGPYSHGTYPGGGRFGLMTVTDRGDSLIVDWSGRNDLDSELVTHRFAVPIVPTLGIRADLHSRPAVFRLGPVYPNPFNASAAITYDLLEPARVTLRVHNALGQQVRVLYEGSLPAGSGRFTWDGRDDRGRPLPSGLYLVHMATAGQQATRKPVLLK